MVSTAYREGYDRIKWSGPAPTRKPRPRVASNSQFPCPQIVRPFRDPLKSMADGKEYDDAVSLRASYRAENNPHGVDFIEVGDEDITKFEKPKKDRKAQRDAIERAICEVESGNAKPVLTTDEYQI